MFTIDREREFGQRMLRRLEQEAANPRVALNVNAPSTRGDVVVRTGTAEVPADGSPVTGVPEYVATYRAGIAPVGLVAGFGVRRAGRRAERNEQQ